MAPKRITVQPGSRAAAPKGVIASTYSALTSPENASVVKSVAVFGVRHFLLALVLRSWLLTLDSLGCHRLLR
ncbi:TOM core complex subunit Tom6 [Xylaria longipes]|nr:TOM core complex subunit Tom6 [Xylaria longipes]